MKYSEQIIQRLIKDMNSVDHSLTHGKSGILLSLCYYYQYECPPQLKEGLKIHLDKCIDELLVSISEEAMDGSLANGLTGIAYSLMACHRMGLTDLVDESWLDDLNPMIKTFLKNQLLKKKYDLLRGATGSVIYMLDYCLDKRYIKIYVDSLFDNAIWESDNSCYWIFYSFNEDKQILEYTENIVNLGLAHGMTGIISVLSKIHALGIEKEKTYLLIQGAINYVLKTESYTQISQFCGIVNTEGNEKQNSSRLGWCYGDLGVGLSILKAGLCCDNPGWKNKGNSICLKTLERTVDNAYLDEHGVCHGYFGTMHMYNRIYNITKNTKFLEARNYWFDLALEKRDFGLDDLGLFQIDHEPNGFLKKYTTPGLLLGLAGVYLCNASIEQINYPWDSIFLLDTEIIN
jgi:lantibiotic modifying enzyme